MAKKTAKEREYNKEYNKNHYKAYSFFADFELSDKIEDYCLTKNVKKADLFRNAVTEYMEKHESD